MSCIDHLCYFPFCSFACFKLFYKFYELFLFIYFDYLPAFCKHVVTIVHVVRICHNSRIAYNMDFLPMLLGDLKTSDHRCVLHRIQY